ncbi:MULTISPECIES: ABC transporter permease [unclassified Frondihabitans]|uniref:ABC transporter permease n=1 Tax=unclassified Frondihabitans TaxID=2626248 RepID=UPI000F514806|nr:MULTISPECIES: ABC transporter permease subunit [unclassified Frondihabitans]RPE75311.1 osmoprotectant transport system permease protein [Frondihabitans sp. PhB153]RPF04553.1 osmoprotectant transport system permease protein [Frondihabitans sp. PhB161]
MKWVLENLPYLADSAWAHLQLSIPPIILSFVLSVPLGWLANRYRLFRGPLLTVAGLLYAIPSLPLLIVLSVVVGLGLRSPVNVVIALTLYGMALMVRSTADALDAVEPDVRQSATAMGFSGLGRFFSVDFPLAGPVLLAGMRVVVVSTVSLVTVGGVLGINGLGLLFTDGLQRGIIAEIVAGIVLTVALALILDGLLVLLGRLLMPWSRATAAPTRRAARRMMATA